ncbi:kinase-like domain-containing protein [Emericellopsis atlantica]|uniref:Kinase-like domain-containing protein n=1 Tax=Emericellopsis atlantica TaxID=2614577 RepID=A0A9P7ZGK7_9HYPO|nr:kinase-like domain-containing protein [Emericellopsis atlantica]KAG9251635.1 kinase-like domain-containing protein [Emericellopsis atlantica]
MEKNDQNYEYTFPDEIAERINNCLGWGNTGFIELVPPGDRVRKFPHPQNRGYDKQWQVQQLCREVEVYQWLPKIHPRLVQMFDYSLDVDDAFVTLEYMPTGTLSKYLASDQPISDAQRAAWCFEAAEAVALLHSHNIIHADIKPENMVLDKNLGLRIIDLSGCAIDVKDPLCLESTRYYLPRDMKTDPLCSVETDLFALGSSLYEIAAGVPPYSQLEDEDVEERYRKGEFPPLQGLMCASVIQACWRCEYISAEDVVAAIQDHHGPSMSRRYVS